MNDVDTMARFWGAAVLAAFRRCPPSGAFCFPEETSPLGDLLPSVAAQYIEAFAQHYGEGVQFARKQVYRGQQIDRSRLGDCGCPPITGGHLVTPYLVVGAGLTPYDRCVSDTGWVNRDHTNELGYSRSFPTRLTEHERLTIIIPKVGGPLAEAVDCRRRVRG